MFPDLFAFFMCVVYLLNVVCLFVLVLYAFDGSGSVDEVSFLSVL